MCATTCEGGHIASIMIMANWVYGIKIYNADQMLRHLNGEDYEVWESKKAAPLHFTPENIRQEFARLDKEASFVKGDSLI
ncbi:hypothetical protein [Marispirochaeta sp.]|uniref:hypothetical protein n=1 Tax=Marispirochaeta sp. TaxID=2038653 RepID=UPI0029C92608|nr:hypothetical protein [Marispirochaeta sp.]